MFVTSYLGNSWYAYVSDRYVSGPWSYLGDVLVDQVDSIFKLKAFSSRVQGESVRAGEERKR